MFTMADFIRPDKPSTCTWTKDADPSTSPHTKAIVKPHRKIMPDIFYAMGNTPLVRLNKIPQSEGIKCEMLVKCEFFNPGGSVKDRICQRMVEDAEKAGLLKPGYTIIEPTSGNTGIGLAMAAAIKGYRCIIVMPERMSDEKANVLKALGAEIYRTPTGVPSDAPDGLITVSQRLQKEIPNSIILNQFMNAGNPLAHYDNTAAEILEQCDGKLDMVVIGTGTGGTVTGIGRRVKELCPTCKVIAVDPVGSSLAYPDSLNETDVTFFEVEGIGYEFIPTVLDRDIVDKWYKVFDKDSFPMAKRLIKEEALLCGGSSGAAVSVAIKATADLREDQRCVVILPDSLRNYLTKFVSDQWMEVRNLQPCLNVNNHWWWDEKVSKLNLKSTESISPTTTCLKAMNTMKKLNLSEVPVIDDEGTLKGILSLKTLMNEIVAAKVKHNDPVTVAIGQKFIKINLDGPLGLLSRILEKDPYAVVVEKTELKEKVIGIAKPIDLLEYITDPDGTNNSN